ncbi:rCG46966 [Rattus norvegicus]|uniref:RCG46966 n=1 Tax=Rattus norvegicus TaxID=10116 RepID=A6IXM3_RAT|nr:rCG46966 [Rattus norvegicus]
MNKTCTMTPSADLPKWMSYKARSLHEKLLRTSLTRGKVSW